MYLNRIFTLTIGFIFFIAPNLTRAQLLIIDSLQRTLKAAKPSRKPVVMAELARATFEKAPAQAILNATNAVNLARKNNDKGAMAFTYATMAHLLMQKDQEKRASGYLDSAVRAADHTSDKAMASFVWFRKGWFELVKGNNEKAMSAFLKADKGIQNENDKRSLSYKTLINHYIASIYAYGSDTLKQHRYAADCLMMARRSGFPDDLQIGYMTLAHSFFSAFEKNLSRRPLLDSSMVYYRQAMNVYRQNREKILLQSNASATALNMANSYFKYYPASYNDSAHKYISIALDIARRTNGREVIANCYGILSEYALREKDFVKAEQYLQTGIAELEKASPGVDITRSRLMLGLANVAEQSGDSRKALSYYKQYISYYTKVFDGQKLAIVQQMEEEYRSALRENEIVRLKERDQLNERLNWLYIAIGSVSIILLMLLLSSYHYKLKASQQQKQLSEQENEEMKLLAQLQQAEAQQLKMEKQEAELQASLREEERGRAEAQQELLRDRTEWLEKELLAGTLKIGEKNAILEQLKERTRNADSPAVAQQIGRMIKQNLRMDKHMDEQQSLGRIHPNFFSMLQERAEKTLTRLDLKYCAYILMGLDNKEMASRLGVEPKSIRMAKYRLKQKLKLEKTEDLDDAIRSFEKTSAGNI